MDVIYNRFFYDLMTKKIDLENDTIKCALVDDTYTPNKDDDYWQSGNDPYDSEVSGTGYTAGGVTLANKSVTLDDTNDRVAWDADDAEWTSSTITAHYAVLYDDSLTNKDLICCFDFTENKSSSSGTFKVQFGSNGIMLMQQGS